MFNTARRSRLATTGFGPGLRNRQCGLSLVEAMCTLAVMAILVGGVLPTLGDLRASQALLASAAVLETDIQHARSLALVDGRPVRLSVQALPDGGTCYVVHTGTAHACRCTGAGETRCEGDAQALRVVEQPAAGGITLAPVQRSILFDGGKGTITPTATLQMKDRDGRAVHQVVNIMGRVRSCVPGRALGGLRACA